MKKILSLALCVFLLLGYSSIALAKSDTKIEKNLIKLGYTREQIDLLSESVKPELAQQADLGAKLVSFKHTEMKESNAFQDVQGEVGMLSEISPSVLYLNASILDYGTVNNWNSRRIYSDFNWQQNPYWKLVDKIGIAWADGWNITYNSDVLVYQYRGENSNTLYTEYYYDGEYTVETGVDFENLDLKELTPNGSEHTKSHSGWAKIDIGKYINQTWENDSERTDVLTKYYHKWYSLGADGSVSVTSGPDISITNSSNYDWAQNQDFFDWPR